MSESSNVSPASDAAATNAVKAPDGAAKPSTQAPAAAPKPPSQNPAFRMMGLPRLRLPSRNWLIFLSITGSIAGAVTYDKLQTKRNREKWCRVVAHLADETLPTNTMPRKMTVYLAAPPSDGLRGAREHFHDYIKPVLVAAAMDWDVVEGRKEGDVRYKTAERIRRRRRRQGEGTPVEEEQSDSAAAVEDMRAKTGTRTFDGVAGDLVIGRNTWKEYIRGLHEGWLGPVDPPPHVLTDQAAEKEDQTSSVTEEQPPPVIATADTAASAVALGTTGHDATPLDQLIVQEATPSETSAADDNTETAEAADKESEAKKEEKKEDKPKRRNPLPFLEPSGFAQAQLSTNTPEILGPSIGVRYPHILGFRNTPIRFYRFLTRRYLADDIGRQVASAVLAAHRPLNEATVDDDGHPVPEAASVLLQEEKNWWKTTYAPRKELEESVWIEPVATDDRVTNRMRIFELTAEDADRAQRPSSES